MEESRKLWLNLEVWTIAFKVVKFWRKTKDSVSELVARSLDSISEYGSAGENTEA